MFESLESRTMFTYMIRADLFVPVERPHIGLTVGGTLNVAGTSASDDVKIGQDDSHDLLLVTVNRHTWRFHADWIKHIEVSLGDGDDRFEFAAPDSYPSWSASRPTLRVRGGAGNDRLVAGSLNSSLFGDAGNDSLVGGEGDDRLVGGKGNDKIDAATFGRFSSTLMWPPEANRISVADRDTVLADGDGKADRVLANSVDEVHTNGSDRVKVRDPKRASLVMYSRPADLTIAQPITGWNAWG